MNTWIMIAIAVVCIPACIFFSVREYRRPDTRRRWWRILATVFSICALLFLIVPIKWKKKISGNSADHIAVFLTQGFIRDSVDRFLKGKENVPVFTEETIWQADLHTALHVFGYGISDATKPFVEQQNIVFHPSKVDQGVVTVYAPGKISAGQTFTVKGKYLNNAAEEVMIKLEGFSTIHDSVVVKGRGEVAFELSTVPKFKGFAGYNLIVQKGGDTLENNHLPLVIDESAGLRILMFSSSPDFEKKFLQQWLSDQAYRIISRTRISKDRFEKNFFNTVSFPVNRMVKKLLDSTDLLIIDEQELANLDVVEKKILKDAVAENGMGVFITGDSSVAGNIFFEETISIGTLKYPGQKIELNLSAAGSKIHLPVSGTVTFIKKNNNALVLAEDSAGHIFAEISGYGRGRVIYSLLPALYPLAVSGNKQLYAMIWSHLLQQVVKPSYDLYSLKVTPDFPLRNNPVHISLRGKNDTLPRLSIGNSVIALKQDHWIPELFTGRYWPRTSGWNTAVVVDKKFPIYVFSSSDWVSVRAIQSIHKTNQLMNDSSVRENVKQKKESYSTMQLPPLFLLFIFILSAGFLWLERKLL